LTDPKAPQKRQAAEAAANLVEDGMIVGLGTGSTATFLIDALIARVQTGLRIQAIATSERSAAQAAAGNIRVLTFADTSSIDLDIDGADEIEPKTLALIKGLGGALLREKIVAAASRRFVVIADDSKLVAKLGEHTPIPVEVSPFGWQSTARQLGELGARPTPRHSPHGDLFVTDGGNMILDCLFGPLDDPAAIDRAIRDIVGVFETGLFLGLASQAIVAGENGLTELRAPTA
jgi:ribose 5-phosphate isomerase A